MGKYSCLENEFKIGFLNGKWKTASAFAIAKGVDPRNGVFKRDSAGWKKQAERESELLNEEAKTRATEEILEEKVAEFRGVFADLNVAAAKMAKKLRDISEGKDCYGNKILNDPFLKEDRDGNVSVDSRAIKYLLEAGNLACLLLKKTNTEDDIPLSAEAKNEITKAKEIKKAPETESKPDPTEGLTEQEIDQKIKELQQ